MVCRSRRLDPFRGYATALTATLPGASDLRRVPSLRARVTAVKGVPVDQVRTSEDTAWELRGDRGLTYAATPPEGTRLATSSMTPSTPTTGVGWIGVEPVWL